MVYSEHAARLIIIRRAKASFPVFLFLVLGIFSLLSCAGVRQETETGAVFPDAGSVSPDTGGASPDTGGVFGLQDTELPASLRFVPAPLSGILPAPGVGLVTREQRDLGSALAEEDRNRLSACFRDAYTEGLFRDLPLEGVFGGDMVHGWPAAAPLTWVQNWRSDEAALNSWAVPSLVLAVQGLAHDRVFIVHGRILDFYGKSAGRGRANGVSGYGAPCGEEFFHQGGIAQRFDYGLISINAEGASFVEETPPSAAAEFPEDAPGENREIREKFRSAWKTAVDRNYPPLSPDADPVYIDFGPDPWIVTAGLRDGSETAIALRGIWYQSYGGGGALFVLADAPGLPSYPRLLTSPWLDAFLAAPEKRLPGAESQDPIPLPDYRSGEDGGLVRALLNSIALYGIPLSDSLPLAESVSAGGAPAAPEENAAPAPAIRYYEAQRFSKGWMRND
ncbi:MAG: hypothetical protein LBP23_08240 [Treponema sp.]|jgi:hypothetical protein|nr:hypothetical protein [Treponema sp.]